ncbi:MFS transporter [Aquirufa nivalisilvae]|uniref:MFS transporter n=1 Tax=Aquirufa nivalisilvae TaxID=2516557 RepID=UPI001032E357|nr:MFS transporter [Aquirufa nivalisilvae]MCZ2483610.1 MFS transporter [Aquirufa nivalisilvae]TBH75806.1 MFS transporter [Aquirufa nivalisilvae]
MIEEKLSSKAKLLIAVAALGYFVDVYDLILFSVVRNPSLKSLGLVGPELLNQGLNLMNIQMGGMLLGGILWGIYGDKKGRKSVLFGSILLYSVANAFNGMVHDLDTYAWLRFLAGIGLAGELGAGITLVNETLPPSKRGIGTLIIAGVGASGAIFAPIVSNFSSDPEWWRTCYFIGGGMGLALLLLRLGTFESGMFLELEKDVKRGNFFQLFSHRNIFKKYLYCILMGLPIWYIIGILVFSSPELLQGMGLKGVITGGDAIMYCYVGLSVGDFASGYLSQVLKSRNKAVMTYLIIAWILTIYFLYAMSDISVVYGNIMITLLGFFGGYWAVFLTSSSEQFGTNLRMTVTTTVPNFVRGALIPISLLFKFLIPNVGMVNSAAIVGALCFGLSIWSVSQLKETFGKSLDFIEE